jgi:hypothetical protein
MLTMGIVKIHLLTTIAIKTFHKLSCQMLRHEPGLVDTVVHLNKTLL